MRLRYLPIVSALFLVIAMTIQFLVSYNRNREDLLERIDYQMDLTQRDFLYKVSNMSDATEEIASYMPEFCDNTNDLYLLLETALRRYKDLFSLYVGFVPNQFPARGERYGVCALRNKNDSIINYRFAKELDYFQREWYIGAMESDDNGHWSQPYRDINRHSLIFTHSRKAYDKSGKVIGVVCADYTLEWTKHLLETTTPYKDAVCRLYSSDGTMIVETQEADWSNMIQSEKVLSPGDMKLVIGVPNHYLWNDLIRISAITFTVLLLGILIAGLLVHRLWKDQEKLLTVETTNKVMERELQIASNIQKGILRANDATDGKNGIDVEVHAELIPMKEVGGDLYDYYRKGENLFFIIGDVSGKSITAAMMMSATINLFRSSTRRLDSPKEIMEELNAVLSENNPSMMFVTAFIGRLHIPTGELLYCNAGHLPPLVRAESRKSQVRSLDLEPNIPLGYESKYKFVEQGTMLEQGESIVLYTDGITESRNINHEMLGFAQWKKLVENYEAAQNDDIGKQLLRKVKSYIGEAEPADDITLMAIMKNSSVESFHVRVENRMEQWPVLRTALHNYGLCAGLEKRTLKKMEVALEEAVVNIINYSEASRIELTISHSPLTITLSDNGIPFDPTAQADVNIPQAMEERQIGGLGISLLRQIADEMTYARVENTNQLTIIKNS